MKYLILCYYFFRSLVLRGPIAHFRLLFEEVYFEKKYGIRSSGFKTSNSRENYHYQAASYSILHRVFAALKPVSDRAAFYDIGCGKGRVLFVASKMGFSNLFGIEMDHELIENAKQNLSETLVKPKMLKLIEQNVLDYSYEDQPSVFFLFNPFNAEVLSKFIDKVLQTNHQECYFVYMNPVHSSVFTQKNIPVWRVIRSFLYTEALIYHLPGTSS